MKTIETIFKISGVLDGSLMSAINAASKAMSGLKGAGKAATAGASDMRNSLAAQLAALQRVQRQYDKYRVALEQLRPGLERVREAMRRRDEVRLETRKAQESLEALKTKLTDLKRERDRSAKNSEQRRALDEQIRAGRIELKLQQGRAGEQERQLKAAQKALEDAAKNYNRTTNTVREMDAALKAAGESTSKIGLMSMALRGKMKEAQAQFERYNQAMTRLQSANDAHTQSASHFNNEWSNMSNAVSTAQSIMQPFKAAVDNAETFEHAMSKVKALTQSQNIKEGNYERVREEMAELEAQARQLGATTQFTMTQAAEAQGYLGMAGWSKDQIIKAMPGMLDLAAASGMDLARTADIVSDNLTALGLDASQVGHMTDVYAYALTRSNLNMEALGESMKYAAPAMHAYGGDIHDAAAAMMIMGNAGIKGSMAGTALRMGLLRLAGPPKKASKEMAALGVSLSDATRMAYESQAQLEALGIHTDANMKPTEKMAYVLRELSTKMQGLSKDEKLAAVGAIFGVNAASGWLAVLEQGPEAFEDFRNALRTSDGTAKQVASTMNDDTRGAWLYLESAIDAVSNNVGSAFLPALKSIYEGLNPVVTSMAEWIGKHPGVVQGIGAMAAAIAGGIVALGGFRLALAGINFATTTIELMKATAAFNALGSAGGIIGGLASKFGGLSSVIGVVGRALAALAGPWGVALVAIATMVIANWDKVGSFFENLGSRISRAMSSAFKTASTLYKAFKDGSLFDKDFSIKGYQQKELGREVVKRNTTLEESEKETAVLATRSATREKASGEEIGKAIATSLSALSNQTAARQDEMFRTVAEELKTRKDLTSETVATALSTLRTEMASARVETSAAMMNELERLTRETNREEFNGRLEDTFASMQASNVAQADRLTSALIAFSERDKATDVTTKLDAITSYVESQTGIKDELKGEIISAFRENMQTDVTARIGEQVSAAIKETSDSKALVDQLTTVMMSQEDRSSASIEMMMTTVQSALEARENSSKAEVEALMSNLQSSVSTAMDEQRAQAAATFESLQASSSDAGAAMTQAGQLAQQLGINAEQAGQMVQILSAGANEAGNAAQAASGGLSGLAGAGNSAASALEGAAARISAIQINVPQVNYVPISTGGAAVGGHAEGGIFPHGAHLTWFAEDSAEAAIPIKRGDSNAISLWQRTGAMLGVLGGQQPSMPMSMPSMSMPSMSNGYISEEMARQGTYSDAVRKSKTFESLDRARRARTFSDEVVDAGSKNPSMMKAGGLFGGLFAGVSPMMSALPLMSNGIISDEMARKIGTFSNEVRKSKSYESMRRAQEKNSGSFLDQQLSTSMMKPLGPFGDIPLQMSMVSPSLSNGYISEEMARQGTYSDAVRKSKTYESLDRARRARTFSDEVVDAGSKNPSMMKAGGLFGGLFAGISPMMSALPSNILSNEQSSESLSSKLQTYDELEQQTMSLSTTTNNDQSMPPITLHFHFDGAVNREDVQKGVEESLPSIRETFEQQMLKYRHEVSRRSF